MANAVTANGIKGDGGFRAENDAGVIQFADVAGITDPAARIVLSDNGVYRHSGLGAQTPFSRLLEASNSGTCSIDNCLVITSTVQWQERGSTKNYSVAVEMYDWK